jgi:hypothetical protein
MDAEQPAPVACSLTSADLAAQGDRWERLVATALTERAETADGLRLAFRAGPESERELRALVAVETDCCAWAQWEVTAGNGQLVLRVRSAGDGVAVLHGMFSWSRP